MDDNAGTDGFPYMTETQTVTPDNQSRRRTNRHMNGHELAKFPKSSGIFRETESATEINRILNDPSVFPEVSIPDQKPFDVGPMITDPRFVFLRTDGGVIAFIPDSDPSSGIWEVHTNFLEDYRGAHAIKASLEAYRWMFTRTNCMMLQTRVPAFNKAAEAFCRLVGASLWFERKEVWPTKTGHVDCRFYAMSFMDWMRNHPEQLIKSGRAFHARLEEEYKRLEFQHDPHPDEDSHDRAVGACAEMIYGGHPEKAVVLYNQWARVAGYVQIQLVSRNPMVLDLGESMLHVSGETFKVIQVRRA